MDRLLSGVRVVDLTNVLAGPYASYQLGLLGAEVVKVELPGRGDLARRLGAVPALNEQGLGTSFLAQNAGKKSVELDLRSDSDRAVFDRLLGAADVLLENFRSGVLARLGYSDERLQGLNSGLIYCSVTGFGCDGPMSSDPAYDQIVQGLSGIMAMTGDERSSPLRVGFPVCDALAGITAAFLISAALAGRQQTGRGARLDVSMLESTLSAMGWPVSNYLIGGVEPAPLGNENPTAAPSGTFRTGDGFLNISANKQSQFEAVCGAIDCADLLTDARFSRPEARRQHRGELNAAITEALAGRGAAEWAALLVAVGVPAAPLLTLADALELEQVRKRKFVAELPFPDRPGAVLRVCTAGGHVDGVVMQPSAPPPKLGEHNAELTELIDRWTSAAEAVDDRSSLIPAREADG